MNQYLPVNWVDGMKIHKDHFIAERNAIQQIVSGSTGAFINTVNYGLLPPVAKEHQPLKFFVALDNQEMISVKLLSCRAVTPGGYLIEVDESKNQQAANLSVAPVLQVALTNYKESPGIYLVVLTIDAFNRVAVGNALPTELPPRIPFAAPSMTVSLVPKDSLDGHFAGLFQLTLAELLVEKNKVQLVDDYIPPCVSLSAHPELVDIFYGLDEFMSKMELYSLQILQKINQKKQSNELALMVQQICERLIQFQSTVFSELKWTGLHQPPYLLFSRIAAQARLVKNSLDIYLNNGKEELLNYFTEWCDLNQGELDSVILELSNHSYNHEDIAGSVNRIVNYTKQISALFYKLSRLDYIGKKREAGIFVKEEVVKNEAPASGAKKRRSFLADE